MSIGVKSMPVDRSAPRVIVQNGGILAHLFA
jgi:hypothetical protein